MRNFVSIKGIKDMLAKSYEEVAAKKEEELDDVTTRQLEVLKHVIFDEYSVGQNSLLNLFTRNLYHDTQLTCIGNVSARAGGNVIHIRDVYIGPDGQYYESTLYAPHVPTLLRGNGFNSKIVTFRIDDHVNSMVAPIGGKITSMLGMFFNCPKLVSVYFGECFDTTNVTTMAQMFQGCTSLTSWIAHEDKLFTTKNVTNMRYMFKDCQSLGGLKLGFFDTAKVTNMEYMFANCVHIWLLDLTSFDTGNVENMQDMFYGCADLEELDLSSFGTGKVTNMSGMFCGCKSLKRLTLSSKFNTKNVTSMLGMFAGGNVGPALESFDLSSFDTSSVTTMKGMFNSFNIPMNTRINVSNFDTSNVTDMSFMFAGSRASVCVSGLDTSKVTTMNAMFNAVASHVYDLTSFDTHNVTSMANMFSSSGCYMALVSRDKWVIRDDCDTTNMFNNTFTDHVTYMDELLICNDENEIKKWKYTPMDTFDLKPGQHGAMVRLHKYRGSDPDLVIYDAYMIDGLLCISLIDIEDGDGIIDIPRRSSIETVTIGRNVIIADGNAALMQFGKLPNLRSVNFGTNVNDMTNMFYNSTLTSIDLSQCDLSNVTRMYQTFYGCSSLEEIIFPDDLDLGKVTNLYRTFYGCTSLQSLNLNSANDIIVNNAYMTFYGCKALTSLDLTSLDVNNATNMHAFINTCPALTEVLVSRAKWNIPSSCNSLLMFNACGTDHFTYDDEVA